MPNDKVEAQRLPVPAPSFPGTMQVSANHSDLVFPTRFGSQVAGTLMHNGEDHSAETLGLSLIQ